MAVSLVSYFYSIVGLSTEALVICNGQIIIIGAAEMIFFFIFFVYYIFLCMTANISILSVAKHAPCSDQPLLRHLARPCVKCYNHFLQAPIEILDGMFI